MSPDNNTGYAGSDSVDNVRAPQQCTCSAPPLKLYSTKRLRVFLRDGCKAPATCSEKPPQPAAIPHPQRPPHGSTARGRLLRKRGGAGGERGRVCGEEDPRDPDRTGQFWCREHREQVRGGMSADVGYEASPPGPVFGGVFPPRLHPACAGHGTSSHQP